MEPFPLSSARVRLTVPTSADVDRVTELCQTSEVQQGTVVPSPYTREDGEGFVESFVATGWREDTDYTWAIRVAGELIGMIGLSVDRSAPQEPSVEIGYWVAPDIAGQGVATEACRLVLDWAFDPEGLGAARAVWLAYVGNWASRRVAWRCGFRLEGTLRRHSVQRGERRDAWIATLLPDDPREPVEPWPHDAPTRAQEALA